MPLLDDAVELQAGGTPHHGAAAEARRIDLNQINADWHNAYASFIIDLSHRLEGLATDAERLDADGRAEADARACRRSCPPPTPLTPVAATGTILHGEPSGE